MWDIRLQSVSKSYAKDAEKAVNDISLHVEEGKLFGLIGPDGAGKTTLFRILTTLILADSGTAQVGGYDVVKDFKVIRNSIGYMPGRFSLYQDLTVKENLRFFATLFNTSIQENYALIEDIYKQIEPFNDRRAGKLSGGMKQKLALCCALIHSPRVLFLDEPTTGVDAVSRKEFWGMLKNLKAKGITIMVSTPYMDEASLCEEIALIQEGNIMSVNTPDEIIDQYPEMLYAIKSKGMNQLLQELRNSELIATANSFGEYHHITLAKQGTKDLLIQALSHREDVELKSVRPTIEDCFINLMSNG
ncbi:MAG: ABC transporter ATP-binding protein [Cyclobacteriaceae bacterium]|nr:ABC transporter ATP-binding protein [Cyclobacteriaceae bacterium SS2]